MAYFKLVLVQVLVFFCGCVNNQTQEWLFGVQCANDGISLNVNRLNDREWELHFSGEYEFVVARVYCHIYEWRKERLPFDNPERHDVEWHDVGFSESVYGFGVIRSPLCGGGGLRRDFRRSWNWTLDSPAKGVTLNGNTSTVVFRVWIVKSNGCGDEVKIEFVFGRPRDPGTIYDEERGAVSLNSARITASGSPASDVRIPLSAAARGLSPLSPIAISIRMKSPLSKQVLIFMRIPYGICSSD